MTTSVVPIRGQSRLQSQRAEVDVFAGQPCEEMVAVAAQPPRGPIRLHRRPWWTQDLAAAAIAIGDFEEEEQARRFAQAARTASVPVNVIDKPAHCDFSFGAIVNRSPLVIGICTDGAAPIFSQAIRARLEAMVPHGFARWAEAARRWRPLVQASGLSLAARRRFWHAFTRFAMLHPARVPARTDFHALLEHTRNSAAAAGAGSVTLVGAGPGDPELLTLRAARALQSADIVLIEEPVAAEVLDFARREAQTIRIGSGSSGRGQEATALMIALARSGRRVVRLTGGDAAAFDPAGEEIAAWRRAGLAVEVVPGVSARRLVRCVVPRHAAAREGAHSKVNSPGTPPRASCVWLEARPERTAAAPQSGDRG